MRHRASFVSALLASAALAAAQSATPPSTPKPAAAIAVGQTVEVREGDAWSKVKVLAREGRRYQVSYDDGTTEWVTADRVRVVGGTAPIGAAPAAPTAPAAPADGDATPAAPAAATPKKPAGFAIGAKIEAKWGGLWSAGVVKNRRGDWHLIAYDSGGRLEWVEPWRLRTPGSNYDIGHASPNPSMSANRLQPPPRDKPGPAPAAADGAADDAGGELPISDVDAGKARVTVPATTPWSYRPAGPATGGPRAGDKPISVAAGTGSFFESIPALDVNGGFALVAQRTTFQGSDSTADVVNLGTGASVAHASLDPSSVATSVSPDGRRVAARSDGKVKTRVDVYDVAGRPEAQHVVSFAPYAATGAFWKDVEDVILLDQTHVLTVNREPLIACWEIGPGSAKAVWQLKGDDGSEIAISPDRKSVATLADKMLIVVNAADGSLQGSIDTTAKSLRSLSFRGDGKRLVGLEGPTLFAFDLENGKQTASLGLPTQLSNSSGVLHLADENVWLTGPNGSIVFDVAARAIVGQYKVDNVQRSAVVGDRLIVVAKDEKRRAICSWAIPGKPAKDAVPLAVVQADAKTKVALDVQIEGDEPTRKAIVDSLGKQVRANGWSLAEGGDAPVRVLVRTENGKSEQQTYGSGPSFGPFARAGETVTVVEKISRVTINVDGKPAWETLRMVKPGMMLMRKEGQTMQQAADDADKFDLAFLKRVALPQTLFVPMDTLPAAPSYALVAGGVRAN